jgi:hypothetical protein
LENEDKFFLKHEREEAEECFFRLSALGACIIEVLAQDHENLLKLICQKYNQMADDYIQSRNPNEE